MKKIIKNPFLTFILGAIIFGSTGFVVAETINASSISYDNSVSHSSYTTVQGAVDDLYNKATSRKNLTELDNAATADDIVVGKKAYDSNGDVIVGTQYLTTTILSDAFSTNGSRSIVMFDNLCQNDKCSRFKVTDITKDSNVSSCTPQSWSTVNSRYVDLELNKEYIIGENNNDDNYNHVALQSYSKNNSYSRCIATVILY